MFYILIKFRIGLPLIDGSLLIAFTPGAVYRFRVASMLFYVVLVMTLTAIKDV